MISAPLSLQLYLAGTGDSIPNTGAGFSAILFLQFTDGHGIYPHVHVDAIQQRAGQFALIFIAAQLGIAAAFRWLLRVSAWAGVEGGNQLEIGRVGDLLRSAGDRDFTGLQWFT